MSSSKGVIKSSDVQVVEKVHHGERLPGTKVGFQTNPLIMEAQKNRGGLAHEQKAELEEKIEQVKRESYDQGLAEGMNKGIALQKAEARRVIGAVTDLMAEMTQLRQGIIGNAEKQIVRLAFAIAAKVIHQEVKQDTTVVASVLREAVRSVTDRDGMKVRLNPQDFRYIMEIKEDFLKEMDGVKNITFEEDPGVKTGGVMVETIFGEVDARLEQQFNEIKAGFNLV
jgi:flagellar assembly protein FliH